MLDSVPDPKFRPLGVIVYSPTWALDKWPFGLPEKITSAPTILSLFLSPVTVSVLLDTSIVVVNVPPYTLVWSNALTINWAGVMVISPFT